MPVLDGLATLQRLRAEHPKVAVVMVSAHTRQGAASTLKALELGALDYIAKPDAGDFAANKELLRGEVARVLEGLATARAPAPAAAPVRPAARAGPALRPQVVAVGSSTGGPQALAQIVPKLPAGLPVPVLLVQHMPPVFTAQLAETLAARSALKVVEAKGGEAPTAGTLYIAPGGHHLRVVEADGARRLELTDDPPENFCRPAVDYLFRSVAQVWGGRALGVILTGMGRDGTEGLRAMKARGANVLGQSADSCTVYGMPREARAAGVVDAELPAERMADAIVAAVSG
jgi:two-component system chemotaxis response regulator CheB